jgi:hypothetical protein
MARELIQWLDEAQESQQLTEGEAGLRKRMKLRCLGLSSLDRTIGRQCSRTRQLSEGDTNTKYFHLIARGRKRRNFIPSLSVDGYTVANHDGMELALFEHFSKVFGTTTSGRTSINFNTGYTTYTPGQTRGRHQL